MPTNCPFESQIAPTQLAPLHNTHTQFKIPNFMRITSREQPSKLHWMILGSIVILSLYFFATIISIAHNGVTTDPAKRQLIEPFTSIDANGRAVDDSLYRSHATFDSPTGGISYPFYIIADLDTDSYDPIKRPSKPDKPSWHSFLLSGALIKQNSPSKKSNTYSFKIGEKHKISSHYGEAGRGMELSELIIWLGRLYAVDDRTGIVYELVTVSPNNNPTALPRFILVGGDGSASVSGKGFKSEWATVKGGSLYIGSMGKPFTAADGSGKIISHGPQFIKRILPSGHIEHIDWISEFDALRKFTHTLKPGYLLHEAVLWSSVHSRWIFAPRRVSNENYDEVKDETRGSNLVITSDASFTSFNKKNVGILTPERGFSSIKFVPGSKEQHIFAIKSVELNGHTATYALVFDWISGEILMEETLLEDNIKYEGLEFI